VVVVMASRLSFMKGLMETRTLDVMVGQSAMELSQQLIKEMTGLALAVSLTILTMM
jgi:hypothetical protein